MVGFYGTEQQRRLQQRTQSMSGWIATTPGVYNAGRFAGIDAPGHFPSSEFDRMLARDGLIGFRMISSSEALAIFPVLEANGCRVDQWDIFVGSLEDAGARARILTDTKMPDGMMIQPKLSEPGGEDTIRVQEFLAANGLAPFPGSMLVVAPPVAKTITFVTEARVVATGHAYFPHNVHSLYHHHAWVGLIAVDEHWRGKGVGRLINALLIRAAFDELGASHVYQMVAPTNGPSRRMVEDCGLRYEHTLRSGVAVPVDSARFTR